MSNDKVIFPHVVLFLLLVVCTFGCGFGHLSNLLLFPIKGDGGEDSRLS